MPSRLPPSRQPSRNAATPGEAVGPLPLPRATISLTQAAKAHAFLRHRGFVTPEDVKAIGLDVLRHRISLTYEAEAEELTTERIIQRIFERVEVP